MACTEFELIERFFNAATRPREDVLLGIGDDCALLRVPAGCELAVSIDTLVSGVHFFADADPQALGHKALAVNLSDLAAMGAEPAWVTLALTLPTADELWLERFMAGFAALADRHQVQLVGGDTTRGPLCITVQAHGVVPQGAALRRDGARVGDRIGVTGSLGDAGLALERLCAGEPLDRSLRARLEQPEPRLAAGIGLRPLANSAIDLSDGLLADLGHICQRSGVGARLELARLPLSEAVEKQVKMRCEWSLPLTSGDDYELCFSVPPQCCAQVEEVLAGEVGGCTWIGVIEEDQGVRCYGTDGRLSRAVQGGYQHFRDAD
ncbi:MAG: thiamine-phosphate kinase [Gammaproteobacteria bacterium]|nr:thiamine-phosphate kinase [Gammaproteobacteria bacterium]